MNTFLICWNLEKEKHPYALQKLMGMSTVFPELDRDTFWKIQSPCGTLLAGSIHTAFHAAEPRRYMSESQDLTLFYSGLPIDPLNSFRGHRAEDLMSHWNCLDNELEGSYFLARMSKKNPSLEIINDCLGMEQVFYYNKKDTWILSNSVFLIENIIGPRRLDDFGASLFLCLGWAGSNHTLREGIKVLPGGQKWRWDRHGFSSHQHSGSFSDSLPRIQKNKNDNDRIEQLTDHLVNLCHTVNDNFQTVESNLTGGKDSRLVLSLLLSSGINQVTYNTSGNPDSRDVRIAKHISKTCLLPYQVCTITTDDVIEKWNDLCVDYIRRNDGMSSLWQIGDALEFPEHPEALKISFWGAGGEVARGYYTKPHQYFKTLSKDNVARQLIEKKTVNDGGLIKTETELSTQHYLKEFVNQAIDIGFSPTDVPDWFFTNQSIGRWSSCNAKRATPVKDLISPFCTKAFVETTFSIPSIQRLVEPLHFRIMKQLHPLLHKIPFDGKPWSYQNAFVNIAQSYAGKILKTGKMNLKKITKSLFQNTQHSRPTWVNRGSPKTFCQESWLEAKRKDILDMCLSQGKQALWNLIDKSTLEKVLSKDECCEYRHKHAGLLMRIATLFYYEHDHSTYNHGHFAIRSTDGLTMEEVTRNASETAFAA